MSNTDLKEYDLTCEEYREYYFSTFESFTMPYRIDNPQKLFVREGGTTHRILDDMGVIHCIPFPYLGTVLRWKNKDISKPCNF